MGFWFPVGIEDFWLSRNSNPLSHHLEWVRSAGEECVELFWLIKPHGKWLHASVRRDMISWAPLVDDSIQGKSINHTQKQQNKLKAKKAIEKMFLSLKGRRDVERSRIWRLFLAFDPPRSSPFVCVRARWHYPGVKKAWKLEKEIPAHEASGER